MTKKQMKQGEFSFKLNWPELNVSEGNYDRHETHHSLDLVQVDPFAQHSPVLHMNTNHSTLKRGVFIHPCSAGFEERHDWFVHHVM